MGSLFHSRILCTLFIVDMVERRLSLDVNALMDTHFLAHNGATGSIISKTWVTSTEIWDVPPS